jgi:hypothetical protein
MGNESDSTLFRSYLTACTEACSGADADASEAAARLAEELPPVVVLQVAAAPLAHVEHEADRTQKARGRFSGAPPAGEGGRGPAGR